jgi:DNA replication and repair protein RecF
VNLFVGDNGAGKTNILEALSFFKIGRSFRTARDTDLIDYSQPFCRVEVHVEKKDAPDEKFSAAIERGGAKRIQVDSKDIATLSELVGLYPCVLFGPQDLELVSGGPDERRRFLDVTGSMTDRVYLEDLRAYRRVLGQRNALLKRPSWGTERNAWDAELVRHGCAVIGKRRRLVETLFSHTKRHADALGLGHDVEMRYDCDVEDGAGDEASLEEQYHTRLACLEEEEVRRGVTLVGPHRDDVRILLGGKDVRRFGSQGQRRLLAVLLRLTELSYADERTGERCILLLDDVFSELDEEASTALRSILEDDHQVFVTSPVPFEWGGNREVQLFGVDSGRVNIEGMSG